MSVKMPKPIIDLTTAPQKGKRALTSSTVSLMPVPIFMGR